MRFLKFLYLNLNSPRIGLKTEDEVRYFITSFIINMQIYKLIFLLPFLFYMCESSGQEKDTKAKRQEPSSFMKTNRLDTIDGVDVSYLMGKFDPEQNKDFTVIDVKYADQAGRYMRKDAYQAFTKLAEAALKSGHKLVIKSATRNFDYQKNIWEKKWIGETTLEDGTKASSIKKSKKRAEKILQYSSMPGTSRHHWGTDIDLNNLNNKYFESGEGKALYEWLQKNAILYGFCQVYSPKGKMRKTGYNEEKWHWSYMPVSSVLSKMAGQKVTNAMITGFKGSETAMEIDMVKNYILAVNSECH